MRPRKRVLYWHQHDVTLSHRAYVLDSKLYSVLKARTAEEALAHLADPDPIDVLVAELPALGLGKVAEAAHGVGTRVLVWGKVDPDVVIADRWIPAEEGMGAMVGLVKVLAARKRGPKKKSPESAPAVIVEERKGRKAA